MLIARIICLLTSMLVFAATGSHADITSLVDLTPDQLVGKWEALMQKDGTCGPGVYQMFFSSPKEAWLVQADPASDPDHVHFLGRLVSEDLANGQINLEFTLLQLAPREAVPHYVPVESEIVSIRIQGQAYRSGDAKTIEGKISKTRKDGKITNDHVFFANTLWTRSIADASMVAEKAIIEARRQSQAK